MANLNNRYDNIVNETGEPFTKGCQKCGKLIPDRRNYCSRSCASSVTATNQHKRPEHTKALSEKRKRLINNSGGRLPWLDDYLSSGRNKENLSRTPERIAKAVAGVNKLVEDGLHPFQQPEVRSKVAKVLAKNKYSSFIERKVKWLLQQKGIQFVHNFPFERSEKMKNGKSRMYFIDFVLSDHKIAIECDGSYWHQDKEADAKRQTEIEKAGFYVLRFSDDQIRKRLHECSAEIDRVINDHLRSDDKQYVNSQ